MLSILLLALSLTGCPRATPDVTNNPTQTNPSNSILGTQATSPSTDETNNQSTNTDPTETTPPTETAPSENTEPTVTPTTPTEGEPEYTKPNHTEPSEPIVTEPPVTEPQETKPSATEPPVTLPPETIPPATEPPATEPPVTTPPTTEPTHAHSYRKTVTSPTCTEGGYTTYSCSCGDSYKDDYTNAKGHTYTDTVVPPTPSQKGYTNHVCSCGYFYTDSYVDPIVDKFPYTGEELAAAVIEYINQLRVQNGSPEIASQPIMCEIAQKRSVQLLTDYRHDTLALRQILAEYKYGRYVDMTQYGFAESYNHYDAQLMEAIGCFAAVDKSIDEIAKHIALGFSNSPSHWSYLGDADMKYIAVGCSKDKYDWYVCIFVSEVTYG